MSWKTVTTGSFQAPGSSRSASSPPRLRAISRLTARPRPVPCSSPLVVKKDSNRRSRIALATPPPLSRDLDDREPRVVRLHAGAHLDQGARRAGDGVERVRQQVDEDLLQRVRGRRQHGDVGRDLGPQGGAGLAQAELEQRRHPHQHLAQLGAALTRLGRGDRHEPQVRHQRGQPLGLLDDVAGEVEHLVQLDPLLLEEELPEPLDREQRLAELVNLLGGEAAELGQAPRRREQLAQAANLLSHGGDARGLFERSVGASGWTVMARSPFPQVGRLWLQ